MFCGCTFIITWENGKNVTWLREKKPNQRGIWISNVEAFGWFWVDFNITYISFNEVIDDWKHFICYHQDFKENEAFIIIHYTSCGKQCVTLLGLLSTLQKLGQNYMCTLIYISMMFKSKHPHCKLATKFPLLKNWCAFERLPTSMELRSVTRVAYHRVWHEDLGFSHQLYHVSIVLLFCRKCHISVGRHFKRLPIPTRVTIQRESAKRLDTHKINGKDQT